jgi:uncharacterized protein YjbI with pentapeptide repeats
MERAMAKRAVATAVPNGRLNALETQASDLGEARKALDSATNIARGLWFTFLSLTAYLVIAVGAVTHRDLFLETPVRLPLLNVDLPLVTFFWVAPIMFLVVHAYLLLNLKFMADNARHYFNEVETTGIAAEARHRLYLQLANFLILQMLIVRRQEKWGVMGFATHFVVVLTVIIAPILVLILIQLQFLPYHSQYVTTIHRLAVAADMVLLLFFWPKIAGVPESGRVAFLRHSTWAVVFLIVLFSSFVATFPGEPGRQTALFKTSHLAEYLFHSPVHQVKGQRQRWFSDTLVLTDADFVSGDDDKVPQEVTVSLRGRNLQGAFLARSDLRGADFTGADLSGANFRDSKLRGAQFGCPLVRLEHGEKSLSQCTILNDAILEGADLRETLMRQAYLRNASLQAARLDGASLEGALLQGALFKDSRLAKVNLWRADLSGAKIENSDLSGARLAEAILGGTLLHKVTLARSDLSGAKLLAPTLLEVNVVGLGVENTDWASSLASNIYESEEAFVLNAPPPGLNTFASASAKKVGSVVDFAVAAAAPQTPDSSSALQVLSRTAIISRGSGDTQNDTAKWKPRLDELQFLLCQQKDELAAVEIFTNLSTMPGSEKDKMLSFGPDRDAFVHRLLEPTCSNRAALKDRVCRLLLVWAGRGALPIKECMQG